MPDIQPGQSRNEDFESASFEDMGKHRDEMLAKNPIAIVGGVRTPFVKSGADGKFTDFGLLDLGKHAVEKLAERCDLDPNKIDEVVYGTVATNARMPNLGREIVLGADISDDTRGRTPTQACVTSLESVEMLVDDILLGKAKVGIAGGVESLSNYPVAHRKSVLQTLERASKIKNPIARLAFVARNLKLRHLMPGRPKVAEHSTGLSMGQHAELTAQELGISRELQDELAYLSQMKATSARANGILAQEIAPLAGVEHDDIIRDNASLEAMAKLKPVFDREKGTITAGHTSPLADGASAVCLMSAQEANRQDREILGYISGIEFAQISTEDGLLQAPGVALPRLMNRHGLTVDDIDRFEVHEAFAAQVLSNQEAWEKGWSKYNVQPIGRLPEDRMNVNGGSIAIGHPFGATGGRLLMALINELRRSDLETGVISACAAGGVASAMLIRRSS